MVAMFLPYASVASMLASEGVYVLLSSSSLPRLIDADLCFSLKLVGLPLAAGS